VSVPSEPVAVPEIVERIAAGRAVVAGWESELDIDRIDYYRRWWDEGDISSH